MNQLDYVEQRHQELIDELVRFLETGDHVPVFGRAKQLGYINQSEWNQAMNTDDYRYFGLRDTLLMFVLLAEGEEF